MLLIGPDLKSGPSGYTYDYIYDPKREFHVYGQLHIGSVRWILS